MYANPYQQIQEGSQPLMQSPPPMQGGMGGAQGALAAVGSSTKLSIKQHLSMVEMAGDAMGGMIPCVECCLERPNDYDVFDSQSGQVLLKVKEESEFCMRCLCNPNHALKLHFTVPVSNEPVIEMDRPFKCGGQCPAWLDCCQQEATPVYVGGGAFAYIKQPCCGGFFTPTVHVSAGPDQAQWATIQGPPCFFGGLTEMCCDQDFPVSRGDDKSGDVAMIKKEKPEGAAAMAAEIMSDADLFTLTFANPAMPQQEKVSLLTAVLLLDYMFFESNSPLECNPVTQECSVVCCNMYCCGAIHPCKCSCGGGDGGE